MQRLGAPISKAVKNLHVTPVSPAHTQVPTGTLSLNSTVPTCWPIEKHVWPIRAAQTWVVQGSRRLCVSLKFHPKPYSTLNLKNVHCIPISKDSSPHCGPALLISASLLGCHNPKTMNIPTWEYPTLSTSVPFSKRSQHCSSQPENRNVCKVRSNDLCEITKNLALDQLLSK